MIREMQAAAVEDDYRVGMIEDYLTDKKEICVLEIWQRALKMSEFSKPSKKDSNEIGLIMQSMSGWEKQPAVKRFDDFGVQKWWMRVREKPQIPVSDMEPF